MIEVARDASLVLKAARAASKFDHYEDQ